MSMELISLINHRFIVIYHSNMSIERTPEFRDTHVLYVVDGSANKFGGVEDHVNTIAGFGRAYGIEPRVMVGEGKNPKEISETLLTSFLPNEIFVTRSRFNESDAPDLVERVAQNLTGAQNYVAPWAGNVQRAVIERMQPDIAHFMLPWQPQHGGRIDKMTRTTTTHRDFARVGTYHIDSDDPWVNRLTRATGHLGRKGLSGFDKMIAVSPVALDHMHRTGFYKGDVEIVPNPVDVHWFADAKPFNDDEVVERGGRKADKYVVFVGRPDDRKGLSELITAYSELNDMLSSQSDVELIICSDGPNLKPIKYQTQLLGIKNVSFVGRVSNEDKARWLSTADLAVFPAKYGETQGIVLVEAMAAGAGVVLGGNNKGYRFTFDDLSDLDKEQVLFNADFDGAASPAERQNRVYRLVEMMHTYLVNESLADEMHEKQQELVRQFDVGVVGKRILQIYKEVLSGKK